MDSKSLDKASRAISTWLSRRQLLKGIAAALAGRASSGNQAQGKGFSQATIEPAAPTAAPQAPIDQAPMDQAPTEPVIPPTEPPMPAATETPWPTETPTPAEHPTSTPTPAEIPIQEPTPTPAIEQAPPVVDDRRRQIAAICKAAADVLAEDVADPGAFENHPHPEDAYGFLQTLNGIAQWGTTAETWDDQLLANYVVCADNIAMAVRIGADTYYELPRSKRLREEFPGDPDTCIFEELAKWRDCVAGCGPDDAVCRLTCFWNFTVLNSCRRCLRAF